MTSFDYLKILSENLSTESKWFLLILFQQKEAINKEQLWDLVNKLHVEAEKKKGNDNPGTLISSRYLLDIHTARLEGAGLVHVKEIGRMRLYSITELGKYLLDFIRKQN